MTIGANEQSTLGKRNVTHAGARLASGAAKAQAVTGFDLDMTLIDSRPGIQAVYDQISRETGVPIDSAQVVTRLGPPTELEMAHWFPPEQVEDAVFRYREIYPEVAIERVSALPGAVDALAAARERGRVILVTAKAADAARRHLEHLGLDVDEVHGLVWRDGKAEVLRLAVADVYVGDHVQDMAAARSAGTQGIGVTTGPCSRRDLLAAGAHRTISSLIELRAILAEQRLP